MRIYVHIRAEYAILAQTKYVEAFTYSLYSYLDFPF